MIGMQPFEFGGKAYLLTNDQAKICKKLQKRKQVGVLRGVLQRQALDVPSGLQVPPSGTSAPPTADQAPKAGEGKRAEPAPAEAPAAAAEENTGEAASSSEEERTPAVAEASEGSKLPPGLELL